MRKYKVEFYHIGNEDNRQTVDTWEAEEWRYPDLTATDYMEASDWELSPTEKISGIIVTLFVDDKAVNSVWWHEGTDGDEFDIIF